MSYMMVPLRPFGRDVFRFHVQEVSSRYERRRFARSVRNVYHGDPHGVPSLLCGRPSSLSPARNPALASVEMGLFMAESSSPGLGTDQVVGTIAALVDRQARDEGVAFFGMFEAINNEEVVAALLEKAEEWVSQRMPEVELMRGPVGLDCPYVPGVLADGYNCPPSRFMPYNPPYYAELIEAAGYSGAGELLVYSLDLASWAAVPEAERIELDSSARCHLAPRASEQQGLAIRQWDIARPASEPSLAGQIYRAGWEPACGSGTAQIQPPCEMLDGLGYLLARHRLRLDPALALECEHEGEAVAVALALPDPGIGRGGLRRLLSPGRLLRSPVGQGPAPLAGLVRRRPDRICILPAGLHPDWREQGLDTLLYAELARAAARRGYRQAEFWPIDAEDAAQQVFEALGARPCRVYRLYEKTPGWSGE